MRKIYKIIVAISTITSPNINTCPTKHSLCTQTQQQLHKSFLQAVCDGNLTRTKQLLQAGADINYQDNAGQTALMKAVKNGCMGRVDDATLRGKTKHTNKKYRKIVWELLDAGADVNLRDNLNKTALFWSAWDGNSEVVCALVDAGAKA